MDHFRATNKNDSVAGENARHSSGRVAAFFLLCALGYLSHSVPAFAQTGREHDFDFNLGTWKTHIRRLPHPLTGSHAWVELNGTVVVRKVWDGRAHLEEVEADGPASHFGGLTLFLYNPQSHQWSLNFANSKDGTLGQPSIGEFRGGRGEFYDQETFNGRAILVRIIWSDITANSHRFEQSFSDDGGKTWEPNFVAMVTRERQVADETGDQAASREPRQCDLDWQQAANSGTLGVPVTGEFKSGRAGENESGQAY